MRGVHESEVTVPSVYTWTHSNTYKHNYKTTKRAELDAVIIITVSKEPTECRPTVDRMSHVGFMAPKYIWSAVSWGSAEWAQGMFATNLRFVRIASERRRGEETVKTECEQRGGLTGGPWGPADPSSPGDPTSPCQGKWQIGVSSRALQIVTKR